MKFLIGLIAIILWIAGLKGEFGIIGFVISVGIFAIGFFQIIQEAKYPKSRISRMSMDDIDKMKGRDFEKFCAILLKSIGYTKVQVTPSSGDFGADIVAVDKKNQRWVFQCKRYASKLGNAPIQEIVAAKSHYQATHAGVITNSVFTTKARQLGIENNVRLIERGELAKLIE